MEEQRGRHSKELMKKDSEREIVSEELDSLTEQYQQLESAFESQSSQLSHSNSEVERLRRELETKTAELGKLTQQDKERRASLSRVSPLWINVLLVSVQFDYFPVSIVIIAEVLRELEGFTPDCANQE